MYHQAAPTQSIQTLVEYMCLYPCPQTVKSLPIVWETQVQSPGREDPVEKETATTPVFLPRKSQGWRSLAGYSTWGCKESNTTKQLHFHFLCVSFSIISHLHMRQWRYFYKAMKHKQSLTFCYHPQPWVFYQLMLLPTVIYVCLAMLFILGHAVISL